MTPPRSKAASKAEAKGSDRSHDRSERSPDDTRLRLIEAATKLFSEQGFDGVSVKELADEAGVNVSLVSYHFGGKENLYRACIEQFGRQRLAVAQRVLQAPKTHEELRFRLQMFYEEMITAHVDSCGVAQMIHRECEMEKGLAPEVFKETFLKVFETAVEFFRSAQKSGLVRKELDPMMVTQLTFGALVHAMRSDKIAEKYFGLSISQPAYRKKLIDQLLQASIHGIATERNPA